jgi:hypothetical protein
MLSMKTKSKSRYVESDGIMVCLMRKVATSNENLKTLCRQLVKIEINMAANNGDTLVEAVISAKRTSPD